MYADEHAPLCAAEIAIAERWERCMRYARKIELYGDDDPHRVAWAQQIIRTETAKQVRQSALNGRRLDERAELIPAQGETA